MLKVWSEDECLYLDYEDEDEFFLVKKCFFNKISANFQVDTTKDRFRNNNNNNNIFAIVQSTVSGFLKDSNTTVGVKNLLRWGSNRRPLVYKADVFTISPRNR